MRGIFFTALVMLFPPVMVAQGLPCAGDLTSDQCERCLSTFEGQEALVPVMCGVPAAAEIAIEEPSKAFATCDFNTCPASIDDYQACIKAAREFFENKEATDVANRYNELVSKPESAICGPDGVAAMAEEIAPLVAAFAHYDSEQQQLFAVCVADEIGKRQEIIDEYWSTSDVTMSYLRMRRAEKELFRLVRLRGESRVIKMFVLGSELAQTQAQIASDVRFCEEVAGQ